MRELSFFQHQMKNKSVLFILGIFLVGIFVAHPVYAQDVVQNLSAVGESAGFGTTGLYTIIGRIIKVFFGILAAVALVLIIFAGYKWMTAAGDEKQIEDAKNILKNGVIGLAIIASSFAITQFVMSKLMGATGTGLKGGSFASEDTTPAYLTGYSGASAMGSVIQWHEPVRDAKNVSRGSIIQVKFKFPIDSASLIDTKSKETVFDGKVAMSGPLKEGSLLIYPTAQGEAEALKSNQVWVTMVDDETNSTFVFDPIPFLGSASNNTDYTVKFSADVKRMQPAGASAFSSFSGGYFWQFVVGTQLDLTPPKLVSVVPVAGGTYDRNVTIQLTFSEPLNLASAVGVFDPSKANKKFENISAKKSDGAIVPGSWSAGDGFNVIEFTTFDECATNSCGQKVFCLPAGQTLEVRAKSGVLVKNAEGVIENSQLDVKLGYTGVVDASNNALDGGGKNSEKPWSSVSGGKPQGSPVDDFYMNFSTTNATKTTAPSVISLEPKFYANINSDPAMNEKAPVSATFDSVLKVTTLGDVALNAKVSKAQAGYWKTVQSIKVTINKVEQTVSKLVIDHAPFAKNSAYAVAIPSSVQDVYQNCFLPAGGLQCTPVASNNQYSCCNGVAAGETCEKLNYGAK